MISDNLLKELALKGVNSVAMQAELDAFVESNTFYKELERLINDDSDLETISRMSFLHPTGTYKVILATQGYEGLELRLHIWPSGIDIETLNNYDSIHNHKWDFASRILTGTVRKRLFRESSSGLTAMKYRFFSPERGKQYETQEVGRAEFEEYFSCRLRAGDSYYQKHDALHMLYPEGSEYTCTLFLRASYLAEETLVCRELGKEVIKDDGVLKRVKQSDIRSLMSGLIESMKREDTCVR